MTSLMSEISDKAFIPLSEPEISGNEWKYLKECLDTGWVSTSGNYVERFENGIQVLVGTPFAVACINGTAALHVSMLLAGVKAGDEVIVPTLTFIAPVNAVRYVQAEPVFMDCDEYMNIDAGKVSDFCNNECEMTAKGLINKRSGRLIKAIVPVHIFGNPCDMERITAVAGKYNIKVIEDATESIGAYYTAGSYINRQTGSIGDFGVFSFNGNKIITTGGGGMLVTKDEAMAEKARYLTTQAKDDPVRYIHNEIGYNYRLTNIQAALGVAQLERLHAFIKCKKKNYELYSKEMDGIKGIHLFPPPGYARSNYWFYSISVNEEEYGMDREKLMQHLLQEGIQTRPVWYLNHLQKPYQGNQSYKIERALWYWKNVFNIPCSSNLTGDAIRRVVTAIQRLQRQ